MVNYNPHNPRKVVNWTVEHIKILRAEHARGSTCSQIALLIPGATRCAVIGKLHRLGLTDSRQACMAGKKRPKRTKPAPGEMVTPKVRGRSRYNVAPLKAVQLVVPTLKDVKLHAKTFLGLEDGQCHWPIHMEGTTQMYCGQTTDNNRESYCPFHHGVATLKVRSSRPNNQYVVRRSKYV